MGYWNGEIENPLDRTFDFDGDGELNWRERNLEADYLVRQAEEEERLHNVNVWGQDGDPWPRYPY